VLFVRSLLLLSNSRYSAMVPCFVRVDFIFVTSELVTWVDPKFSGLTL